MSSLTSRRKAEYRGYKIKMERRDLCWTVSVSPTRSDLPILSRYSFRTITQSARAAMAQAKQRVDLASAKRVDPFASKSRSKHARQSTTISPNDKLNVTKYSRVETKDGITGTEVARNYSWIGEGSILDTKCLAEQNGGLYVTAETQEEIAEAFERMLGCPMISKSSLSR